MCSINTIAFVYTIYYPLILSIYVYKLKTIYKGKKMLKLTVSRKLKSKTIKITFLDSYNILGSSLENLAKDFNINCLKGKFPYSFVNENTLEYIGPTPSINYFNNINYNFL